MSNANEINTHTATRLDDDDPVPGLDSPAHDRHGMSMGMGMGMGMGMSMSMGMIMGMGMGMGMGMRMGMSMSMGKGERMGEGAGQSKDVAASRQAAARTADIGGQHSTNSTRHTSQSGQVIKQSEQGGYLSRSEIIAQRAKR
jgi:hypothetical protein